VGAYKNLSQVERAFRSYKTDLDVRPLHHRRLLHRARTRSSADPPDGASPLARAAFAPVPVVGPGQARGERLHRGVREDVRQHHLGLQHLPHP